MGLRLRQQTSGIRASAWSSILVLAMLAPLMTCVSEARDVPSDARTADPPAAATEVGSLEFYVLANTQFTLLHELGHALIHTLELPVLGREEDAADTLAIAGLLIGEKELQQQHLLERLIVISDEWLLEWNESQSQATYWDSHSLEIQRFYNIVCLIYGSDARRFRHVAFGSALPAERAFVCEDEFKSARHAVEWVLAENGTLSRLRTAHPPRADAAVKVSYETPSTPNGAWLAALLARDRLIDRMAADVDAAFRLPQGIEIQVVNCADADAYFHTESRIVVLCWPLIEKFVELGKRRKAAGPQSLCAAPVAAKLQPSRLGCPTSVDDTRGIDDQPVGR